MQKKVLIINACGTIEGDVRMLLMGLPFLAEHGFQIHCVSIPRGDVYKRLSGFPFVQMKTMELGGRELRSPNRFDPFARLLEMIWATLRIAFFAWRQKIDVIYALDRTVSLQISYLVSKLMQAPLVVSAHQPFYLEHSSKHRHIVKNAEMVTVNSRFVYKHFLPHVDTEDKLVVIYNALNSNRYDPTLSGETIRGQFNIPADAPVVLLAGRLDPFKGQDTLIRAAALVLKARDDIYFLLAGREYAAGYADHLQALINEHGINHRVKLIGYRTDLPEVIAAATICTMPSYSESFGIVALEAMMMAKPVIATRSGGVVEFVTHGETGFLIEPNDHERFAQYILRLIHDEKLHRQMGYKGRRHVLQRFSVESYGQQVVATLNEVLDKKSSGGQRRSKQMSIGGGLLCLTLLSWKLFYEALLGTALRSTDHVADLVKMIPI